MLSKAELKRVISAVPEPDDDNVGKWVVAVALAVEAEARAQDTALIRQLVEALEVTASDVCQAAHHKKRDRHGNGDACPVQARHDAAITAARSRLLDSDLSKLTDRGAKAWTGIDAQDLREGGKP